MLIQLEISHLSCSIALCFLLSLIVLDSFTLCDLVTLIQEKPQLLDLFAMIAWTNGAEGIKLASTNQFCQ